MPRRKIALLDAPSNLGLRPPEKGAPPGCYKAPFAVRDRGLLKRLKAEDAGALVPPRYRATWKRGAGTRNAEAIAECSARLADRVGALLARGRFPLVLGGDCSILIGNMLAMRRRGRAGLVFLDAHSDFRHPGNTDAIRAAAGEDLAIVTGRGDERLINLGGVRPYVREDDVQVIGVRPGDVYLEELREHGVAAITSAEAIDRGADDTAAASLRRVGQCAAGFWIHLDADVVDASEMPAADCPEPNGLSFSYLARLLRLLLASPECAGMELTIYDPDLDQTGAVAERIVRCLSAAFRRAT
jgi:arginase